MLGLWWCQRDTGTIGPTQRVVSRYFSGVVVVGFCSGVLFGPFEILLVVCVLVPFDLGFCFRRRWELCFACPMYLVLYLLCFFALLLFLAFMLGFFSHVFGSVSVFFVLLACLRGVLGLGQETGMDMGME